MLLFLCAATIGMNAFLLFLIQPIAAKTLLPLFGGAPAVWNVCMLFFQGMLLFGYLYTYVMTKMIKGVSQYYCHGILVLLSMLSIPIILQYGNNPLTQIPSINVLIILLTNLALPLLTICTTSPLIQYWFAHTSHQKANDPYFLYSASNIGSLGALLGFIVFLEPFIGLKKLTYHWSCMYGLLMALLTATIWKCYKKKKQGSLCAISAPAPSLRTRLEWVLLSFAPSSLLMAVTQYISSDFVTTALLWILPLLLYLLSFIIAFANKPIISHQWILREQTLFLIFPLITLTKITLTVPAWQLVVFHLLGFFALSLVCIGELVAKRPNNVYLTEFYLTIAIGGFLGCVFNTWIAPLLFTGIYEYYIAFCLCIALRPWPGHYRIKELIIPLAMLSMLFFYPSTLILILVIITLILICCQHPVNLAICITLLFSCSQTIPGFNPQDLIWQSRNFFGVTRIYQKPELNLHILTNGSTLHGAQLLSDDPALSHAKTYYQPVEAIAPLLKGNRRIGIAGLGSGIMSCQLRKHQVTFFEIDPTIIKLAQTPRYFSYLAQCPSKGGIIEGDARLNLAKYKNDFFDILIIDAFSSDAIPTHLYTQEAIALYVSKLKPDGFLMFNISSRHLNFYPVLATIAAQLEMEALHLYAPADYNEFQLPSEWVILTKNDALAHSLQEKLAWQKDTPRYKQLWTDDFSNILRVLKTG